MKTVPGTTQLLASPPGSGKWFRMVADTTATAIFLYRDRLLYVNRACEVMTGYSTAELLAMDPISLVHPEARAEVLARARARLAGDLIPPHQELKIVTKQAELRWIDVSAALIEMEGEPAILVTAIDISDRRRAEQALRDSEEWFRALADSTSTAIFVYTDRFLYLNQAFERLSEYSLADLAGRTLADLVHPDFRKLLRRRGGRRAQRDPTPSRFEFILLTRSAEERWVDFTAGVIHFAGEPATLGTAVDITDRKRIELALRQSEERLHLAQRAAAVVTWDWNLLTDQLIVSDYAAELLGVPIESIGATSRDFFLHLVHPDDRENVLLAVRGALKEGRDYWIEHRIISPGGEEKWLVERGQAVRDESNWAVRMVGVSIDITERKRAELALRESEERYRQMFEKNQAMKLLIDPTTGLIVGANPASVAFYGYPLEQLKRMRITDLNMLSPAEVEAAMARAASEQTSHFTFPHRLASGEIRRVEVHSSPVDTAQGRLLYSIIHDVTERLRAEEALHHEKELAQVTLASIGDGVIRTDASGRVDYLNPVAERLTGVSSAEAAGRPVEEVFKVVDEATRKPLLNPVARCLEESRTVILPGKRLLVSRDGAEFSVRDTAAPIRGLSGEVLGAVLVFKDVTEVRDMEREMSYLATHDGLTGLLNRREFERHIEQALSRAEQAGETHALFYLDLDQFKVINDTCGHLAGDEMLKQIARLLQAKTRKGDVLARLGGDEFGLLLRSCRMEAARQLAEAVRHDLKDYRFAWRDRSFEVSVSIGLVPLSAASDSVSRVLIAADTACYLAKESGRNRVHEYQADDVALAERYGEMHWIHRIYKALAEDRFELYFQRIQPLGAGERLSELLIRLRDSDGHLVEPAAFVPAAERYQLISSIDRWVVRSAFATLGGGDALAAPEVDRFTINISGQSLNEETFLAYVLEQLEESGVAPGRVCFEITETAAIANLSGAIRLISVLKGMGCRFILDDFGSGMSSFAYLKNLPVDFLKIDGEFTRRVAEDPMHYALVSSINQIGHILSLQTIAEGVEDEATYEALKEIGVDFTQGYWIALPQPLLEEPRVVRGNA